MSETIKNPQEYGYDGSEIIQVPVQEYWRLKELVDESLLEETKHFFPEKYQYVNRETGEAIAKLTEKNKAIAKRIVNVEGTLQSAPTTYRTPRGMKLLEIKMAMNIIHVEMIKQGIAKHIPTLQAEKEAEEAKKK